MSGRTTSLARHLLCAVPQLQDPNFKRSVVLMLEHTSEGALGLVLNNLLPNTVVEVAEGLGLQWAGDEADTVRLGGPCEPMRGWVLHDQPSWDSHAQRLVDGLWLTTSLDPIDKDAALGGDGERFMFVLGYAGWGAHQLEDEIATGSWVAVPLLGADDPPLAETDAARMGVDGSWVFEAQPQSMWDEALRSIGVDPGCLVGLKGGDTALH